MSVKSYKSKEIEKNSSSSTKKESSLSKSLPNEITGMMQEPIFEIDPMGLSREIRIGHPETELAKQLGVLKTQVDNISSLDEREPLSSDQGEILRKYISLKEIENSDLKDLLQQHQTYLRRLNQEMEEGVSKNRDLVLELESVRKREESARAELKALKENRSEEIASIRQDYEEKLKSSGNYEAEVALLDEKREQWKERIKQELNRIKLKERELENRNELLKRDMQSLLDSKDRHLLDLKKRADAQELELETLEEKLRQTSQTIGLVGSKKRRLIETLKLAVSLLEGIDKAPNEDEIDEQNRKLVG